MIQTVKTLEEAPRLVEFCNQVAGEETTTTTYKVFAYDLKLHPKGLLVINTKNLQGKFMISDDALPDMADIADIHTTYFKKCDTKLQAVNFNWRIRQTVPAKMPLQVVLKDGVVDRILNANLFRAQRSPILATISNSTPENVRKEDLKVIQHAWNGHFDISVIAPTLNCEPRKGDLVAFGVNISEGRDGAIQVQGSAYRCSCNNGAVNRICDNQQHRIRRPINRPDCEPAFLQKIGSFVREAWLQCPEHIDGLQRLTGIQVDSQQLAAFRSRLRQAPFFLSLGVINRIIRRLEIEVAQNQMRPTLYDLYNAMTFVGTHDEQLSATYRSRLRYGAGEFSRHKSGICGECSQLLLK